MRYRVETYVDAPPAAVWEVLLDWEGSAAWMVDATEVEVLGFQRTGVGTRVRAVTRVAGVPLTDVMEVTRWEDQRLIEVRHERWPIKGPASFILEPEGRGTRFRWVEDLAEPFGFAGRLGAGMTRPAVEKLLRTSLERLRKLVEGSAHVGGSR